MDLGLATAAVVDDEGGALGDVLAVEEAFAGLAPAQVGKGGQSEAGVELSLVALAQPAQGALDAVGAKVPDPEEAKEKPHVSTVAAVHHIQLRMQNRKLVQIIIWVVVISMVLALVISAISLIA